MNTNQHYRRRATAYPATVRHASSKVRLGRAIQPGRPVRFLKLPPSSWLTGALPGRSIELLRLPKRRAPIAGFSAPHYILCLPRQSYVNFVVRQSPRNGTKTLNAAAHQCSELPCASSHFALSKRSR